MDINGKHYTLSDLRKKMPKYDTFQVDKVTPGSQEYKLDSDPIATTNPNLHIRQDLSKQVKRGPYEISDRVYRLFGFIGTKIYSYKKKFIHDEDDTTKSEIP